MPRPGHAPGVDGAHRPVPLRPPGAARGAADARTVDLRRHAAGTPLKRGFATWLRLFDGLIRRRAPVVLNAMDAAEHGGDGTDALGLPSTRAAAPRHWQVRLRARGRGDARELQVSGRSSDLPGRGRRSSRRARPRHGATVAAAGQGQPIIGSEAVRPRSRLHLQNPDKRIISPSPTGDFTLFRHHRRRARRGDRRARIGADGSPTCASRRAATSSVR